MLPFKLIVHDACRPYKWARPTAEKLCYYRRTDELGLLESKPDLLEWLRVEPNVPELMFLQQGFPTWKRRQREGVRWRIRRLLRLKWDVNIVHIFGRDPVRLDWCEKLCELYGDYGEERLYLRVP